VMWINDRGLLEPFLHGDLALALEKLTIHIKQVSDDQIGVEGGYDWESWYPENGTYTVRRGMVRERVARLGANYPMLRHFMTFFSRPRGVLSLGFECWTTSGSGIQDDGAVVVAKAVITRREFTTWRGTQARALDALVRNIPGRQVRLKAIWVMCTKTEDRAGMGQLDVDVQDAPGFGPAKISCRF
jgi:hypothetical protein